MYKAHEINRGRDVLCSISMTKKINKNNYASNTFHTPLHFQPQPNAVDLGQQRSSK